MTTIILLLLIIKHFIIDAPLQTPYQYMNKGKYGHWGGISHAMFHGIGTFLCFVPFDVTVITCIAFGVVDSMIHYHIDWVKINISSNKYSKVTYDHTGKKCLCIYDNKFFLWLVADQSLHFTTYVLLINAPVLNLL